MRSVLYVPYNIRTHNPVSPTLFGNIERGVGAYQQGAQVIIFRRAFGHAEAGGNVDGFAVAFQVQIGHCASNPFRGGLGAGSLGVE